MNIIKLKDTIMPNIPDHSDISTLFNNELKGKYAYWVQMRYIVPFSKLNDSLYVDCEQDESKLENIPHIDMYSTECCMIKFIEIYIDNEETDLINNISKYKSDNNYTTDPDLTIEQIKLFRQWLANSLLELNNNYKNLNDEQIHILNYYSNNMYNDIIKYLSLFGSDIESSNSIQTTCSCCNTSNFYSLTNISVCDSLSIYKKNIHQNMVNMFSDVNFWLQYPTQFMSLFKKYIDNIIQVNLKINNNKHDYISNYVDCGCNTNDDINQNTKILQNLSTSLKYIIDNEYKSHKNYIYNSLYDWSYNLYEYMQW